MGWDEVGGLEVWEEFLVLWFPLQKGVAGFIPIALPF
jgi:hypothetical protein